MTRPLRILVSGLAFNYPLGGVFWDYLQYPLGLRRLGHEVLYVEDTGRWCYDAANKTFVPSGRANADLIGGHLRRLDPDLLWSFRDGSGEVFGQSWPQTVQFCRDADLLINISASLWMRDEYWSVRRLAFIDSDPMYTQGSVSAYVAGSADADARGKVEMIQRHHVHFTFALNIDGPDCRIPRQLITWLPTRQPILLDSFTPHRIAPSARRPVFTTVASLEPTEKGPVIDGVSYTGKTTEFLRFLNLPSHSPLPLEAALSGPAPRDRLSEAGWLLRDGYEVSSDPWVYRDYLASSTAEWSVAKNAYVAGRTGWFSCRTACYLALGVPAIVQDTGFSPYIPTGRGLLTFSTPDQAADALAQVVADPAAHAAAAAAIAAEHFSSDKVLSSLLDRALP